MVETPEELQCSIGAEANFVSGAIKTRLGIRRIDHESLGGQIRAFEIALSEASAANPKFARFSGGNWLAVFIEDVQLRVGDGQTERDAFGRSYAID